MANMKDVARLARTSVATVSFVLNDSGPVSPALRTRVLRAIEELNYRPNAIARSLTTRKTKTIGLITPNILTPFSPPLIRAIEQEVTREGYSLLLALSDENAARERELIALMAEKRVDGLLVSVWDEENVEQLEALRAEGMRIVLAARRVERLKDFDAVVCDNARGAYAAVTHLLEAGCRDVALLALPPRALSERDRILGYEQAHRDRGLQPRPELRHWGSSSLNPHSIALSHAITGDLFALPRPPDGIFVCNQTMVFGILQALNSLGLRVPGDVAVACFDDAPWLQHLHVPLTAVAQRPELLGAKAAQLLLRRLRGELTSAAPVIEVIPTQLIVRESTAGRAGSQPAKDRR